MIRSCVVFLLLGLSPTFAQNTTADTEVAPKICKTFINLDPDYQDYKTFYCGTAITWPVAPENLAKTEMNDEAFAQYTKVYKMYLEDPQEDPLLGISRHCLAVLRKIACAKYFPYCDEETGRTTVLGVCSVSCEMLRDRCPTSPETIKTICNVETKEKCAIGKITSFVLILALTLQTVIF